MSGFERLLAGRILVNRYRIEEVIGRGGFAVVYRAHDERLDRTVAVKVMVVHAPDTEMRERLQARFHREARIAASLQHPNVVTVYDFGTDTELELDFLVMELLRGEDLAGRLRRAGPPQLKLGARILRDAAWGLAAGHRAGMVHRDVKPGNIFLALQDRPGRFRVCVLDFGIAQIKVGDTHTPLTRGHAPLSPAFASPEQLRGEQSLTPASDVFSLGVVGYYLLTGERPFDTSQTDRAPALAALPRVRARNPAVSEALEDVIHRAMALEPGDRFPDAAAMGEALDRAYGTVAATAGPPTPVPVPAAAPAAPGTESRRRVAPAWIAGVLALVAVIAALWAIGRDGDEPAGPVAVGETPAVVLQNPAPPAADPPVAQPDGDAPAEPSPEVAPPGAAVPPARPSVVPTRPVANPPAPARTAPARAQIARPVAASPAPTSAASVNRQGEVQFEQGNSAGAVTLFRRAVQLDPDNPYYRNNLGWALLQAGQVDGAERELAETVRLDPNRAIAYANIGEVHLARGDTAAAIQAYERFLDLNTNARREEIAQGKLRRLRSGGDSP